MIRLALLLALALVPLDVAAEAFAVAGNNTVTITLYDTACESSAVKNLPMRVHWKEKEKEFEGCWSLNAFNIIMMYFEDKTIVALPAQAFKKVSET